MAKKKIHIRNPEELQAAIAMAKPGATIPVTKEEMELLRVTAIGIVSDGSTASYYELPAGAKELQDVIAHKDMNAQIGEIFRACHRYGEVAHSDKYRDIKKIIFYAEAEKKRLETYEAKFLV